MFGRDVLTLRSCRPKMPSSWPAPWPRKIVRDAAHLFIPFSLAGLLLLLGGALLITWGRLSGGVLIGFCATAGVLVGLFVTCHLALYCARAGGDAGDAGGSGAASSSASSDGPGSPGPVGIPVRVRSPRVCASCLGGLPRADVVASQGGNRNAHEVSHGY